MRQIYYKSDFEFLLKPMDNSGKEVYMPNCDWAVSFWTGDRHKVYKAWHKDGTYHNCFVDNGKIHFVFNNHGLGAGKLVWEPHFELPNDVFPAGVQDLFSRLDLGIELTRTACPCPCDAEVEALLPYIKGEPFRYEDFTPGQIEELQRPATEKIAEVDRALKEVVSAENAVADAEGLRVSAEQERDKAEAVRKANEDTRTAGEQARVKAEEQRVADEASRQTAEEKRETAESKRAEEFKGFEATLEGKADLDELDDAVFCEPTEKVIEAIEPGIVTEALRKVPQELSDAEKAQVLENLGNPEFKLFIDMWNTACGQYGKYDPVNAPDPEHPFYLNTLWLTYKEAVKIYSKWSNSNYIREQYNNAGIRTIIPHPLRDGVIAESAFYGSSVEIVRLSYYSGWMRFGTNGSNAIFRRCKKLRKILDSQLEISKDNLIFEWCESLEDVNIKFTGTALSLAHSPRLSLDTLEYLVLNSANKATFTIHPDVYSKLTDEANTEWHKVLTDAVAKNITFATT